MSKLFAKTTALWAAIMTSPAFAQNAAANPPGSGPINNALVWIQGTLLGNLATTAAVIAVAACGFMMLTGRMNWKFGATVVMGCFVLFGAAAIVAGIQSAAVG
jgi:type IV secretory pathway VirB2 component (pilin)